MDKKLYEKCQQLFDEADEMTAKLLWTLGYVFVLFILFSYWAGTML